MQISKNAPKSPRSYSNSGRNPYLYSVWILQAPGTEYVSSKFVSFPRHKNCPRFHKLITRSRPPPRWFHKLITKLFSYRMEAWKKINSVYYVYPPMPRSWEDGSFTTCLIRWTGPIGWGLFDQENGGTGSLEKEWNIVWFHSSDLKQIQLKRAATPIKKHMQYSHMLKPTKWVGNKIWHGPGQDKYYPKVTSVDLSLNFIADERLFPGYTGYRQQVYIYIF